MDEFYRHDSMFRKSYAKYKTAAVLIPPLIALLCFGLSRRTEVSSIVLNLICLLAASGLAAELLTRSIPADIAFTDGGIMVKSGARPWQKIPYSELEDINCFYMTEKLWGILPVWKDWVLLIDRGKKHSKKWFVRSSCAENFDYLLERLEKEYLAYCKNTYGSFDPYNDKMYFGNRLTIQNGKLSLGISYSVPLRILRAFCTEDTGETQINCRMDDGQERKWITLDPMHFERLFLLRFLLNKFSKISTER